MDLLQFVLATLVLELTPGPNMAYLAALSLARGRTAGLIATAGVAAGLSVHAVAAAFGVGALIQAAPLLYEALRWLGVAYLVFLAWDGWRSANHQDELTEATTTEIVPLFGRGFLSNLFNPKSVLFFVSVVPGFVVPGSSGASSMAVLGLVYVVIATAVHAVIVLLAAQLRPYLVAGPYRSLTQQSLALALLAVAAWLAWKTAR